MNRSFAARSAFVLLTVFSVSACRTSRDLRNNQDAYEDPTEIKTIEGPQQTSGPAPSADVESLQRDLAITQGELENIRNQSQQERENLNSRIASLEAENQKLASEIEKMKGASATQAAEAQSEEAKKKASPEGLFESARKDLREGEIKTAAQALDEFTKKYPKNSKYPQALMLLGMSHYRLGHFNDAALTFNQVIEKYPKKSDVALAWFGQGASFHQLGQKEDAKFLFEQITKRYPKSAEAREARRMLGRKAKVPADLFAVFSTWTTAALK